MDHARAALRPVGLGPAEDQRRPEAVGRRARLELVFRAAGGRTVLAHEYAEPPFRVGRTLPWPGGVHVIVASSAPGLFGGDAFEQHVTVERGARVLLTSQSALQVHPSTGGAVARVRSTFDVEDGAELVCHWDPTIPFAASALDQRITVRLTPAARVVWADAFMAGRAGRGERWRFSSFAHELRVTRGNRLEYLERHRIRPDTVAPDTAWMAGEACYFGSTIAIGWPFGEADAERLHRACGVHAPLHAAVDRLERDLLLARFAGTVGPAFHDARATVRDALETLRRAMT